MENVIYYSTFALTFLLCAVVLVRIGLMAADNAVESNRVKLRVCLHLNLIGILSGTVVFHTVVWVLGFMGIVLNFGHGEVLIAVVFFNILIAFLLSLVGMIFLPWKSLQWW